MKYLTSFLLLLFIAVELCSQVDIIHAAVEFSFVPKGIAVDHLNRDIYLGSQHLDKISRISYTKRMADVVAPSQYHYSAGAGLDVVDGNLYALSKVDRSEASQLIVLDTETDSLIGQYKFLQGPSSFSDLAVQDSVVYITDTQRHRVYKCDKNEGNIDVFLEDQDLRYPNGIAISDERSRLFVHYRTGGIQIVDLGSGHILNDGDAAMPSLGLEGLKYHRGDLYGIANGKDIAPGEHGLYKFSLSGTEDEIVAVSPILIGHPLMDMPTTFDIINDTVYLLANSQIKQLDQEENVIVNPTALRPTYILRFSL